MRVLTLLIILSIGATLAQGEQSQVLTLAEVLDLAPTMNPNVLSARSDLTAARRTLGRYQADPLALRVPTLQAQQAAENARAALASARLSAYTDATSAYFDALAATTALRIAEKAVALQTARLQASEIRLEVGAATKLELLQAQNSFAEAQRTQQDAEQTQNLAYRALGSLVGESVSRVAPISLTTPAVPTLEQSLAEAATGNSGVKAAATSAEIAEAELAAVDNAFSAQADIDAARDTLASVKSDLETARLGLELSVQQAHSALESAARVFDNFQASLAASQEELAAQEARLAAGSLAPIDYQEAQLAHLQNEAELYSTLYRFRLAALELEQTTSGGASAESNLSIDTSAPDSSGTTEPSSGTENIDMEEDVTEPVPDTNPTPDTTEPDATAEPAPLDSSTEPDTP